MPPQQQYPLQPSRQRRYALLILMGLSTLLLSLTLDALWWSVLPLLWGGYCWREKMPAIAFALEPQGGLLLQTAAGKWLPVELDTQTRIWLPWLILSWSGGRYVIWPDSCHQEAQRQLRIWLRWHWAFASSSSMVIKN